MKGFTIFELVIVILLVGTLAVFSMPLLHQASKSSELSYDNNTVIADGRMALLRVTRDLLNIRSNTASDLIIPAVNNNTCGTGSAGRTSLTFIDANGTSYQYQLSSGNLTRNNIILSPNTSALCFTFYDASGNLTQTSATTRYIKISFTLTKDESIDSFSGLTFIRNSK